MENLCPLIAHILNTTVDLVSGSVHESLAPVCQVRWVTAPVCQVRWVTAVHEVVSVSLTVEVVIRNLLVETLSCHISRHSAES